MDGNLNNITPLSQEVMEGDAKEGWRRLTKALGLREKEVISLVGAGGKTTLMFSLTEELLLQGMKVVTTTTTKIREPSRKESPYLFVGSDDMKLRKEVEDHLGRYGHMTIARDRVSGGKLKGISSALVLALWDTQAIDYLIVEADGAAGRPVKAPRDHEPVIPANTTLTVGLLGVDGIEATLGERSAFQPARITEITGVPQGTVLSARAAAMLVTHPKGIFKGTPPASRRAVFLNKVDTFDGERKAMLTAHEMFKHHHPQLERIILGHVNKEPPVAEVVFP